MKILLPFLSLLAYSQTLTPTLSEPFSYPGSSFVLTIAYANNNTSSPPIAGLQWTVTMPAGFTMGTPVPGAASTLAAKTITCSSTTFICIAFGNNTNNYAPGIIATIPITLTLTAPIGAQQVSLTSLVASTLTGTGVPITSPGPASIQINTSTGTTPWFQVSVGQATCRASKVAQTPLRVSWICFNSYGANAGSYTADLNNGGNGANFFYIGINSLGGVTATVADENLSCQVQINATANQMTMIDGTPVPANSGVYSCTGYSMSGSGVLQWP
jgi:hypothetical protein